MLIVKGLGSQTLSLRALPSPDPVSLGERRHQGPHRLCDRLVRHHGDPVLRRLVSTFLRILGGAYQLQSVRRGYEPPHHQRRLQLVVRLHHAGDWLADVPADEAAVEEEVAFGGDFLARCLCHLGCHLEQSLLVFAAFWCDVDILVCARVLDGAVGSKSALRLEILGKDHRHQFFDRCHSTRNHSSGLGAEGQSDEPTRLVQ